MRQNFPLEKHQSIEKGVGKKSVPSGSIKMPSWKGEMMNKLALLIWGFFTKLSKHKRSPKCWCLYMAINEEGLLHLPSLGWVWPCP